MAHWVILPLLVVLFGALAALIQGAFWVVRLQSAKQEQWLKHRLGVEDISAPDDDSLEASLLKEQAQDAAFEWLGNMGEGLRQVIRAAGSEMTVTALLVQIGLVTFVAGVAGMMVAGTTGFFLAMPAGALPYLRLQKKAQKRSDALLQQMPDALELMSRAMQAGSGLSDSFRLVAEEMPLPIAAEWGRVFEEVRFGKEWRSALHQLVDRNPMLFDLRLFASSILLQRETGGNLIESLDNISKMIRGRYVFDAKVQAMTSEARTSAMVLAVMPLGVIALIMLANPDYLTPLIQDPIGNVVLMYCVASYVFGLYAMKYVSSVDV